MRTDVTLNDLRSKVSELMKDNRPILLEHQRDLNKRYAEFHERLIDSIRDYLEIRPGDEFKVGYSRYKTTIRVSGPGDNVPILWFVHGSEEYEPRPGRKVYYRVPAYVKQYPILTCGPKSLDVDKTTTLGDVVDMLGQDHRAKQEALFVELCETIDVNPEDLEIILDCYHDVVSDKQRFRQCIERLKEAWDPKTESYPD